MMYWIKRGARLLGIGVFFLVLTGMLVRQNAFELQSMMMAVGYAFFSGIACWFLGIVVSDIIIKGIITDIGDTGVDGLLEGGLLQRFHMMREQLVPGGSEVPFSGPVTEKKKSGKGKAKKANG